MASIRADALHQANSGLAARCETVAAEDLNVTGMRANRRLARAVADQGFGAARRMLGYKTGWHGGRLIIAGRWYPSSKTCSACGHTEDRDVNAARNLLGLAASGADSENACGGTARPGLAGRVPVNQEPGTADAGKTGTAAWQQAAAGSRHVHAH